MTKTRITSAFFEGKVSFYENLKQSFWLWWYQRKIKNSEIKNKLLRLKYCRKGYHKLSHGYKGKSYGERSTMVYYLKCAHCNYIFFASPEDKKHYLDLTAKERSAWLAPLSSRSRNKLSLKPSVGAQSEIVSASGGTG